ncbi:MAG: diguanylate cyclase [Limnothrix sp. RL_2_0]|nr:diguanylate cyclase [Limnothrix sp. RL_2_0]
MIPEKPFEVQKKTLILVIDDDPIMRRLIRFSMEKDGYEVTEASNGQEGLKVFWERVPDIVLLDLMMPVMNGLDFCRELQNLVSQQSELLQSKEMPCELKDEGCSTFEIVSHEPSERLLSSIMRTPILMITALDDDDSVTQAFEVGATDFITKPINWAILRQRVKHLIQQAKLYQRLEVVNEQLQRLAAIDPLTQLANRRVFDMVFERQWRLMLRNQSPLSLIFADIDYFKNYNDTYGHQAGDHCLFEVAQAIAAQVKRPTDLVARYGGEEIIVVLPDTQSADASMLAQRIQESVRALKILHKNSEIASYVTVSLGVASVSEPYHSQNRERLLAIADAALYEAKANGRDDLVTKVLLPEQ